MAGPNALEDETVEQSSKPLELHPTPEAMPDTAFGEIIEEGPNYRNVGLHSPNRMPNIHSQPPLPRSDGWVQWPS